MVFANTLTLVYLVCVCFFFFFGNTFTNGGWLPLPCNHDISTIKWCCLLLQYRLGSLSILVKIIEITLRNVIKYFVSENCVFREGENSKVCYKSSKYHNFTVFFFFFVFVFVFVFLHMKKGNGDSNKSCKFQLHSFKMAT